MGKTQTTSLKNSSESPPGAGTSSNQKRPGDPKNGFKSIDPHLVIGNIISLGGSEIVARAVAFIGMTYLARELGPPAFGIIGFAAAVCGYISLTVRAGFDDIGAREVALRPREASTIAVSVILVRLALAILALFAVGIISLILDKPPIVKMVVFLTGLSFFSLSVDTAWVHRGLERNRRVGFALVLGQVLYVGTILIVVRDPGDVVLVPLAQFFGEMSAALLLSVSVLRLGAIKPKLHEGLNILRSSGALIVTQFLRMLILSFDIVLLGFLLGERAVGLYTAPYRICFLLYAIALAIHMSYLPVLSRAATRSMEEIAGIAGRSVELSSAISAPMVVGGIILSGPLLKTVFGQGYSEGAGALSLLILSMGFLFIHVAIHNILLVCHRMKTEMWITGIAAGLNVILNIIFIPRFGIIGAAFTTALAEGLILLIGFITVNKIGVRLSLRPVSRPLLASCVMGASLMALGPGWGFAARIGIGFVIYVTVLAGLKGIPQDIREYIRH